MQALICAAGGQIDAHPQDKALCLASLFLQLPGTQCEPPVSVSPFADFAQRPSASLPAQTRLGRVV
jgi:hypothetical protein